MSRHAARDLLHMSDITRILNSIEQGDPRAADELLPLIYAELRRLAAAKMAREQPEHTLQATALVHGQRTRRPHAGYRLFRASFKANSKSRSTPARRSEMLRVTG